VTPSELLFFTLAILIAWLIGYLVVDRLFPDSYPRWLVWAFAPLTGMGICSLIVFYFRRPMFTIDGILLFILLIFWFRSHGIPVIHWREIGSWRVSVLVVVFAVAMGWVVGSSVALIERSPHGGTDGWAIWDSHARYMFAGGPTWKRDMENTFHPDYPFLLPGMIVHAWRYIGNNVPDAAGFIGLLFELAGIAVLAATLVKLRHRTVALLMAFVLIGSPRYVLHSLSHYADVPLSVFLLSTVALICLYEEEASRPLGPMVLAGFMAGCAAWTKNEGLPFLLLTSAALFVPFFWMPLAALRRIMAFAAGLAIPLAAIVYFKMTTAFPNEIFGGLNSSELMAKILNPDRYLIIFGHFLTNGWSFGGWVFNPFIPILAFVGLSGANREIFRSFSWRTGVAIIVMLLATYYAIYVITPLGPLDLESSLDRLLMHVWPVCLLLAGMTVPRRVSAEHS
jgi:hypothetical protein